VVLTPNNVQLLRAELIRKRRLDKLRWIGLPSKTERSQIFQVHLNRLRPLRVQNNEFDFELLGDWSKNFSGAEIEQIIYKAMQQGFSRGKEFTQGDLLDAIAVCIPLARLAQPQIEALKTWAAWTVAKSVSLQESVFSNKQMLSLLEVDY